MCVVLYPCKVTLQSRFIHTFFLEYFDDNDDEEEDDGDNDEDEADEGGDSDGEDGKLSDVRQKNAVFCYQAPSNS